MLPGGASILRNGTKQDFLFRQIHVLLIRHLPMQWFKCVKNIHEYVVLIMDLLIFFDTAKLTRNLSGKVTADTGDLT